ncbi:hypothetical protein ACUY4R_000898 [Kosakonia sp. BK9b]
MIYWLTGVAVFTRKIRLFSVVSALLLYATLRSLTYSPLLTSLALAVLIGSFIALLIMKSSREQKSTVYFSVPCWMLLGTVIINLFLRP